MHSWIRNALAEVGVREVMAQCNVSDMLRDVREAVVIKEQVKRQLAREISEFILEHATFEEMVNQYDMTRSYRVRTWLADDDAISKLTQGSVRVMEPMDITWIPPPPPAPPPRYIEAHIASVPAGEIPEKPTAEMLSVYDDAYNAALFNADDKVSPEERGIEAVLKLLRKPV